MLGQANLITCFSSTKFGILVWAGGHFSLFFISICVTGKEGSRSL